MHSRFVQGVLVISLLIPAPSVRADSRTNDILIGAGIVGGLAAGAYAIGSLFFNTSDEDVISQARANYHEATARYGAILAALEMAFDVDSSTVTLSSERTLFAQMQEATLERIARDYIPRDSNINELLRRLKQARNALKDSRDELGKRARKGGSFQMRQLADELDTELRRLAFLHHCLRYHASYFKLYKTVVAVENYYPQVLHYAQLYCNNSAACASALHTIIVSSGKQYPYIAYCDWLLGDEQALKDGRYQLNSTYPSLHARAQQLDSQLSFARYAIAHSEPYARDLRNREYDRLQEERMRIERERIALMQRQEAERVAAMQRMENERIRLEQERLRLERERLAMAAAHHTAHYGEPSAHVYLEVEITD